MYDLINLCTDPRTRVILTTFSDHCICWLLSTYLWVTPCLLHQLSAHFCPEKIFWMLTTHSPYIVHYAVVFWPLQLIWPIDCASWFVMSYAELWIDVLLNFHMYHLIFAWFFSSCLPLSSRLSFFTLHCCWWIFSSHFWEWAENRCLSSVFRNTEFCP